MWAWSWRPGPNSRARRTAILSGRSSKGSSPTTKLLEDFRLDLDGAAGPVAGAFRVQRHGIYRNDAQYPDGRVVPKLDNPFGGEMSVRVEEGYLEFQSRYARIGFGSMYRNWGLPNLDGFLRSDYAYSQEEVSYRVGTDRIYLVGMFASYGDYGTDTTHYVAVHRLEIRPIDELLISVSESSVHGGPGQSLSWKLINPVGIWQIARTDGDPPYNKLGQVDVWWRTGVGFNVYGSLLADATNDNGSCCQMGGSLGVEVPRLAPGLLLRANFSALQSLAYTPNNLEEEPGMGTLHGRADRDWLGQGRPLPVLARGRVVSHRRAVASPEARRAGPGSVRHSGRSPSP